VHIPGETQCQMGVWVPSKKVFLPGDDFYKTFPNLYAIRGTVPRTVTGWVESLDKIRRLEPEFLVGSHTKPLLGKEEVRGGGDGVVLGD
jgi:alkyl sulfatase BDS1-like metallo-beta-lactamase superfamily hydrolase